MPTIPGGGSSGHAVTQTSLPPTLCASQLAGSSTHGLPQATRAEDKSNTQARTRIGRK